MKYGLLLKGEGGKWYVIGEFDNIPALKQSYMEDMKDFGFNNIKPFSYMTVRIEMDDGLDDAVIGGVER